MTLTKDSIVELAEDVTSGSDSGRMTFPEALGKLAAGGVESYMCDLRRGTRTFYLPDGSSVVVEAETLATPIAPEFDAVTVETAVRRSQANAHTYLQFLDMVMGAGCCGYIVSLMGRRVVYFGRTGETHVEVFPNNP